MLRDAVSRYATVSLMSLALWRCALGASCVQVVLLRWSSLEAFYSERGVYPVAALRAGTTWKAGPLQYITSDAALHAVFALCLLVALAFTVGFGTRVVKWLLLPVLVTLHARTWSLFTGGEAVLHSQALYVTLLPVGARLSVDTWLARRRSGPQHDSAQQPNAVQSLAYPLLLLQLAIIYWFNARSKTGASWQEGRAVAESLSSPSLATDFGAWIAHLPEPFLRSLTHGTVAVETLLPFLLLSPWKRKYTHALAGALMLALHGGIFLTMGVGIFGAAMLSYLPLLWHAKDEPSRISVRSIRLRRFEMLAVGVFVYVIGARLSRDLVLWRERPHVPFPDSLNAVTRVFGLLQPWMMFSPEPPRYDFVLVTDAVTRRGRHFDPWDQAATGNAEVLKELRASLIRPPTFDSYENYLNFGAPEFRPFFSRWVLRQQLSPEDPVERFDAWTLAIPTDPREVVAPERLEKRVGVMPLPLTGALPVARFKSHGVWAPERALDGKIVPEGTHVFTPVSASLSAGCPDLTLDLGEAKNLHSAFLQADASDHLLIEGSLDGAAFRALAEMVPQPGRQHLSRVVTLPGEATRFVRIRPKRSGPQYNLSEVALFEHLVALPTLPARPSETFVAALQRPAVVSLISGSNHPNADCPAESSRAR